MEVLNTTLFNGKPVVVRNDELFYFNDMIELEKKRFLFWKFKVLIQKGPFREDEINSLTNAFPRLEIFLRNMNKEWDAIKYEFTSYTNTTFYGYLRGKNYFSYKYPDVDIIKGAAHPVRYKVKYIDLIKSLLNKNHEIKVYEIL